MSRTAMASAAHKNRQQSRVTPADLARRPHGNARPGRTASGRNQNPGRSRRRQEPGAVRTGSTVRIEQDLSHPANRRMVVDPDGMRRYVPDPTAHRPATVGRIDALRTDEVTGARQFHVGAVGLWFDAASRRDIHTGAMLAVIVDDQDQGHRS